MNKRTYHHLKKILKEHNAEVEGIRKYDKQTIHSSNFFARYAHHNRIMKCINYVFPRLEFGKILDYGCGTGVFISLLDKLKPNSAIGYEPFMTEKYTKNSIIFSDYNAILSCNKSSYRHRGGGGRAGRRPPPPPTAWGG
jgi:hypothetical protein